MTAWHPRPSFYLQETNTLREVFNFNYWREQKVTDSAWKHKISTSQINYLPRNGV